MYVGSGMPERDATSARLCATPDVSGRVCGGWVYAAHQNGQRPCVHSTLPCFTGSFSRLVPASTGTTNQLGPFLTMQDMLAMLVAFLRLSIAVARGPSADHVLQQSARQNGEAGVENAPASFTEPCLSRIPNRAHMVWLNGGAMSWVHLLSMLSVVSIARPLRFELHYDVAPPESPQWKCACMLAHCIQVAHVVTLNGQAVDGAHRSDIMRFEVLARAGGLYVDFDAFVLKSLDAIRCASQAQAVAGLEHFSATITKVNNGVLLAAPNSTFLRLWKESYRDWRPSEPYDYRCCVASWDLYLRHRDLVEVTTDLGPFPYHGEHVCGYAGDLDQSAVAHITGLSNAPWRQRTVRECGLLQSILSRVQSAAERMGLQRESRRCAQRIAQGLNASGLLW